MSAMTNPKIPRDIQQQVLIKSWMEPEFRELVLRDPVQALKSMGYELPPEAEVIVVTQPAHVLLLGVADHPAGSPTATTDGGSGVSAQSDQSSKDGTCGYFCSYTLDCNCTKTPRCDATSQSDNPNCGKKWGH